MPVMFNTILAQDGIDASQVRLLRHQDTRADTIRSPYELWRDDRPGFESYQSVQSTQNRAKFASPYWASFVADFAGATLFAGLYAAQYVGVGDKDLSLDRTGKGWTRPGHMICTVSN
ncbi:hypothetical protein ABID58_002436 [Bradyrhizobium sp. S3.2.6]|uniref:hypothetical protein n=1 Tax=Bradyrhizobium sp. S3.2.6 TaxID=3156428 RepID=UPI00339AC15E